MTSRLDAVVASWPVSYNVVLSMKICDKHFFKLHSRSYHKTYEENKVDSGILTASESLSKTRDQYIVQEILSHSR